MINIFHFWGRWLPHKVSQVKRPLVLAFIMTIILPMTVTPKLFAQQPASRPWPSAEMLFETTGRASEAEVVTDIFGIVHVFWSYAAPGTGNEALYYTRKENGHWLEPVDVLISPDNRGARMHSVVVDDNGYVHIAWSGGNAIFYSRAYAPQAASPQAWLSPIALVTGASALEPSITIDSDGNLYLMWTQAGSGLMLARSTDSGDNWTRPEVIFSTPEDNELVRWAHIVSDNAGQLHIAFTHTIQLASGGNPHFQYYLRSQDSGATWSEPYLIIDEPDFGQVNAATYADHVVHLTWNGRAGRHGRYHRWSNDGGNNWSDISEFLAPAPQNPIGIGGLTGIPAMVVDNTGGLHLVSSQGVEIYYFSWQAGVWSQPVFITAGIDGRGVTGTTGSLEQPSIAISEGNKIHVVFHDGFERIWYTTSQLDLPHEPPRLLVSPEINETTSSTIDENITEDTIMATPSSSQWQEPMAPPMSQFDSLWYAIVSVILFLGTVITIRKLYR